MVRESPRCASQALCQVLGTLTDVYSGRAEQPFTSEHKREESSGRSAGKGVDQEGGAEWPDRGPRVGDIALARPDREGLWMDPFHVSGCGARHMKRIHPCQQRGHRLKSPYRRKGHGTFGHRKRPVAAMSLSRRGLAGNETRVGRDLPQNPSLPFTNCIFLAGFYRLLEAWISSSIRWK